MWLEALRKFPVGQVTKRCGFAVSTWYAWLKGERTPYHDSLVVLRKFAEEALPEKERLSIIKRAYTCATKGKVSTVFGY